MISGLKYQGGWWFRVFGYGLSCDDRRINKPLFSCRNRIKCHHVGPYCFEFLQPRATQQKLVSKETK